VRKNLKRNLVNLGVFAPLPTGRQVGGKKLEGEKRRLGEIEKLGN
jgi:hypothetical protein